MKKYNLKFYVPYYHTYKLTFFTAQLLICLSKTYAYTLELLRVVLFANFSEGLRK